MKNLGFHRHLAAVILGLVIAPVTQLQIAVAFRVHSVVGSKELSANYFYKLSRTR